MKVEGSFPSCIWVTRQTLIPNNLSDAEMSMDVLNLLGSNTYY